MHVQKCKRHTIHCHLFCFLDCESEDVIAHECTGGFLRWVLTRFLPQWDWHCLVKDDTSLPSARINDTDSDAFLLSRDMFGWPLNRARLFEVGTLRETCRLAVPASVTSRHTDIANLSGYSIISELFEPCNLDCATLLVAPSDFWQEFLKIIRLHENVKHDDVHSLPATAEFHVYIHFDM